MDAGSTGAIFQWDGTANTFVLSVDGSPVYTVVEATQGITFAAAVTVVGALTGTLTGNADTATALATARNINGVAFDGTGNITVTAAAGTLTGTTLKSTVVTSSLTSLGTVAILEGGTGHFTGKVGIEQALGSAALAVTESTINQSAVHITHDHVSDPFGMIIDFSADDPDDNDNFFLFCSDSSATRCRIWSDGDVETADAGTLTSDETLKENIIDATSKLDDVLKLRVINFNWNDVIHTRGTENQMRKRISYGAREVEAIFPGLVVERDISPLGGRPLIKKFVRQGTIGAPILVKAFQEYVVESRIEIAALKVRIDLLETLV